jgi:hypothetical protein
MAVRRWIVLVAMAVLAGGVPVTTLAQEEEQPPCASICWDEEDACIAQCDDEDEACVRACTDAGDACRKGCGEEE